MKISAGPSIPPTAATSGIAARRGECSAPPGAVASVTSFAARAKKNAIADVVDEEMETMGDGEVAVAIEVGPDERDRRAEHEQTRIVDERSYRLAQSCGREPAVLDLCEHRHMHAGNDVGRGHVAA